MLNFLIIFELFVVITYVAASYNGPFILWGRKELNNLEVSSLNDLDEKFLRDIYAESPAIILFVRNASSRLNEENFPIFKELLQKTKYIYLAQHRLPVDPVDYNLNGEVQTNTNKPSHSTVIIQYSHFQIGYQFGWAAIATGC